MKRFFNFPYQFALTCSYSWVKERERQCRSTVWVSCPWSRYSDPYDSHSNLSMSSSERQKAGHRVSNIIQPWSCKYLWGKAIRVALAVFLERLWRPLHLFLLSISAKQLKMDNFSPRTSLDKLNPQHEFDELLKISWISIYLQEMMKVLYTEDTVANLKDNDISPGKWINILNEKIFFQTSKDKAACFWFSFW